MASGSEYHESNVSMDLDGMHEEDAEGEDEEPQSERVYKTSLRGRRVAIAKYKESDSEADPLATAGYDDEQNGGVAADLDEEDAPRPATRRLRSRPNPVVLSSDEGESGSGRRYATRSQSKRPEPSNRARQAVDFVGGHPLRRLAFQCVTADELVYDLVGLLVMTRMQMVMSTLTSRTTLQMTRWRMLYRRRRPTLLSTRARMLMQMAMSRSTAKARMRYCRVTESLTHCASVSK
jgi:hypothetical protein